MTGSRQGYVKYVKSKSGVEEAVDECIALLFFRNKGR